MHHLPLTAGEFELMEILWRLGEGSVKQVWERVALDRDLAYTTVMTVLDKMRRKGLLRHRKQGKAYFYAPALEREEALEAVLEQLVATYFRGSQSDLEQFLLRRSPGFGAIAAPPSASASAIAAERPAKAERARLRDIDEFLL